MVSTAAAGAAMWERRTSGAVAVSTSCAAAGVATTCTAATGSTFRRRLSRVAGLRGTSLRYVGMGLLRRRRQLEDAVRAGRDGEGVVLPDRVLRRRQLAAGHQLAGTGRRARHPDHRVLDVG